MKVNVLCIATNCVTFTLMTNAKLLKNKLLQLQIL